MLFYAYLKLHIVHVLCSYTHTVHTVVCVNEVVHLELPTTQPRVIDYLTINPKILVQNLRTLLLSCWPGEPNRLPNNIGYCCYTWLPPRG